LPIAARIGSAAANAASVPPTMNVSVPPRRRDAAGNRGIHDRVASRARHLGQAPRGGDIDGGAIDQQGPAGAVPITWFSITSPTIAPLGSIVTTTSAPVTASATVEQGVQPASCAAASAARTDRTRAPVARLGEVGGHAAAHVAQANECNCRHGSLSRCKRCWY
jgi:hypothetical protein